MAFSKKNLLEVYEWNIPTETGILNSFFLMEDQRKLKKFKYLSERTEDRVFEYTLILLILYIGAKISMRL